MKQTLREQIESLLKRVNERLAQCKQWLIYYVRRMLPKHKCKYCGCMTRQPDSECYARPE